MTRIKPAQLLARLEIVVQIDAGPRRLRDVLELELIGHFSLPALQAAERAEALEQKVAILIEERGQECDRNGTIARLALTGSGSLNLIGACHVLPSDSPQVAAAKNHRKSANPLLQRIRDLTPEEFEKFGAKVLAELGAHETYVTRQSNDQGIDFYGVLSIGKITSAPEKFFRLAHDLQLRFAGQAKHYPNNPVGTSVVRELVGALALARHKTLSVEDDLFEKLELRPLNPVVPLLFTTGVFTAGARGLAEKVGILARSGEQLAAFLADRGVGMVPLGDDKAFDQSAFDAWLTS